MELFKIFNGKSVDEIKEHTGFSASLSWTQLLPAVQDMVMLRNDEYIEGWVITDSGIEVKISRKPGPKIKAKE